MNQITAPTCDELFDEKLGDAVMTEDDTSWRHGSYRSQVYHRASDDTYWMANYRLSNDGETNELREGCAEIKQVWPIQVTKTDYTSNRPAGE